MTLLGRAEERDQVDRALAAARQGRSGVLVLRGEPGIGKTALLEYAAIAAAGLEVAQVEAVEPEMALDFAALHQLLLPYLGAIDALPRPQRDALSAAFWWTRSRRRAFPARSRSAVRRTQRSPRPPVARHFRWARSRASATCSATHKVSVITAPPATSA